MSKSESAPSVQGGAVKFTPLEAELYDALVEAEKLINHFGDVLNGLDCVAEVEEDTGVSNDWCDSVFQRVRAALAKARGESLDPTGTPK